MISENKEQEKKNNAGKAFLRAVGRSRIIAVLSALTDFLSRKAAVCIFAGIVSAYEKAAEKYEQTFFYSLFQGYGENKIKKVLRGLKKSFILKCEQSATVNAIKSLADRLLFLQLKSIGIFLASFGFYSAIMYFLKVYIFNETGVMTVDIITSAACAVVAAILLFTKHTVYSALYSSKFLGSLIYRFFAFEEKHPPEYGTRRVGSLAFFIAGMVAGVASFRVMPLLVIGAFFGLAFIYVMLCKPEMGMYLIIVMLPFMPRDFRPSIMTSCIVIFTGICFFLKAARGKRAVSFEVLDLFVLMFLLVMLLAGLFSVGGTGSLKPALIYCCFISVYFLIKNMLVTREQIFKAVYALVVSGGIVSLYGVYQNYFGTGDKTWQDAAMFSGISGRVISTFENPNVLAEYLILVIPFIIALFFLAETAKKRLLTGGGFILSGLCLIFTWSRGSWLGFMFSAVILLVFINRKVIIAYIGALLMLPFATFFLPSSIVERFTSIGNISDSSTSYRVSIWKAAVKMIGDYFWTGIGVGEESFRVVYQNYSLAGIESAPHSHNLYFQTIIEMGIFGLAILFAVIFLFLQGCAFGIKHNAGRDKGMKLIICAGLCGVAGYLLNGFTDYIWYNYRVFLMFWVIIAVVSAANSYTYRNSAVKNSEMYQ